MMDWRRNARVCRRRREWNGEPKKEEMIWLMEARLSYVTSQYQYVLYESTQYNTGLVAYSDTALSDNRLQGQFW